MRFDVLEHRAAYQTFELFGGTLPKKTSTLWVFGKSHKLAFTPQSSKRNSRHTPKTGDQERQAGQIPHVLHTPTHLVFNHKTIIQSECKHKKKWSVCPDTFQGYFMTARNHTKRRGNCPGCTKEKQVPSTTSQETSTTKKRRASQDLRSNRDLCSISRSDSVVVLD